MSSIVFLKSKIHRATVTESDLHYEGSISICPNLMEIGDLHEYEQVHVLNVTNGERFVTYAIPSDKNGEIKINGAAARLASPGDIIIILSYIHISLGDLAYGDKWEPKKVFVDPTNRIITKHT